MIQKKSNNIKNPVYDEMQIVMITRSVHVITKYSLQGSKSFPTFSYSVWCQHSLQNHQHKQVLYGPVGPKVVPAGIYILWESGKRFFKCSSSIHITWKIYRVDQKFLFFTLIFNSNEFTMAGCVYSVPCIFFPEKLSLICS